MNENMNQQGQPVQGQPGQYYQQNQQFQQPQYNQQMPYGQQPYGQMYNMAPPQPPKKSFFSRFHTDKFHWTDQFLLVGLISIVLLICGELVGELLTYGLFAANLADDPTGFFNITVMYFNFIGIWIVLCLYMAIVPKNRPILKAIGTAPKGNNILFLVIGLLIGFGTNMICAIGAMLHKDISISFDSLPVVELLLLFCAVFVQSSAEELLCRGFMYQKLRKGYKNPWVAIILNAVFFGALHLGNPGVGFLAILDIVATGIFFSLMVYYTDSIWCAMAAHAAWNYTQNIILGLPNSGIVSPFSIFKLDAAAATSSFAYNVDFGLEGTILAVSVQIAGCIVLFLLFHNKHEKDYEPWNN